MNKDGNIRVAIFGYGESAMMAAERLKEIQKDVVIIQNPKDVADRIIIDKIKEDKTFLSFQEIPKIESSKFKCKGKKHEYSNVDGKWICTCGKELH